MRCCNPGSASSYLHCRNSLQESPTPLGLKRQAVRQSSRPFRSGERSRSPRTWSSFCARRAPGISVAISPIVIVSAAVPFFKPEPQLHTDIEPGFVVCQLPSHPFAPQTPGHLFRASMSFQIGPALTSPALTGWPATRRIKPASTITTKREMRTIGLTQKL